MYICKICGNEVTYKSEKVKSVDVEYRIKKNSKHGKLIKKTHGYESEENWTYSCTNEKCDNYIDNSIPEDRVFDLEIISEWKR